MIVIDKVYGEEEIKENVLIELINSRPIQRLKGIAQLGMPEKYYHLKNGFSRYEHSVGVLILLRRLGTDLKEQVAGLLHDVSHTAFSHVMDWIVGDPTKEDYQDKKLLEIMGNSELSEILERHGYDYIEIASHENFSLLEQDAPRICADRIDYLLRELAMDGNSDEIEIIVDGLCNIGGRIVFNSVESGRVFSQNYVKCQRENWGGIQARSRYYFLSLILRKALDLGIVTIDDFHDKGDIEIINMVIGSGNGELISRLELLENNFRVWESDKEGIEIKKKFRWVDPEIFFEENVKKLSEIDFEYRKILEEEKINSSRLVRVKIEEFENEHN